MVPVRLSQRGDRSRTRGRPSVSSHGSRSGDQPDLTGASPATSRTLVDNDAKSPDRLRAPFVGDDAPERLIEIFAVPQERSAQHTFLYCADLAEGAVATAIFQGRAGFEPMNTDHVEREFRGHPRAF